MPLKKKKFPLELEIRRLDLLYRQNFAGFVVVFIASVAYILITWQNLSPWFLVPWFVILNTSTVCRMLAYRSWMRVRSTVTTMAQAKRWLRLMHFMLSFSGLGWGIIGWISPHSPMSQQAITTLIISAMVGGTLATNAPSRTAMHCVGIPSLSLWAISMLLTGERYYIIMAIVVLVFMVMMVVVGKNLNQSVNISLELDTKLRESEERLRLARDSSHAMSWNWDLHNGDMVCEGNLKLIPNPEENLKNLIYERMNAGGSLDIEYPFEGSDRLMHYIAVRGKIFRDENNQPTRVAGICWDITAQKNEEILRHERDLHEAANKSKSIFLANVSHEIRTPLAAINGFAEALLQRPNLDEPVRNDVRVIVRHGKYLISLVNDLLDLSKIETHRLYIQKASMNPVQEIEDSLSVIKSALEYKNLELRINYLSLIPERIESDPTRFRQVLINLLSNAVKFTEKGNVTLEVRYVLKDQGGQLVLSVSDTGAGMTAETCQNLFKPFYRGETPEVQRVQGSGLGLALSRNLARLMGGDLELSQCLLGEGTRFEFSVDVGPLHGINLVAASTLKREKIETVAPSVSKMFLTGRKVLVVDDASDLRTLMKRYLEKEGAEVHAAENGLDAMKKALALSYDLILMDIKMPVMDGYQATRGLRENGYHRPIIALTANASLEDQQMCYQAGCDGYLSKPVDMVLLSEMLQTQRYSMRNYEDNGVEL